MCYKKWNSILGNLAKIATENIKLPIYFFLSTASMYFKCMLAYLNA